MGAGSGYFDDPSAPSSLPGPVKAVRVVLYIAAAFTALLVVAGIVAFGLTPELAGALVWESWEGVVAFIVALNLKKPSRVKFWLIIVIAAFYIVGAVASLGGGDPRGITGLILPILLLVFVLRRESRRYFFRRSEQG